MTDPLLVARRVHFLAIGGARNSCLARVAIARGLEVSGTDPVPNAWTDLLASLGARVFSGHSADNLRSARPDLIVTSAAISADNPELVAAAAAGIPVVTGAEYLGHLMAAHPGPRVGVTGTHGKTTTSAMLATALRAAGRSPTALIGGDIDPGTGNTMIGDGGVFVTEACEAYDSFLHLRPDVGVITNVEADHLDHFGSLARIHDSFVRFARNVTNGGVLLYGAEDVGATAVAAEAASRPDLRLAPFGIGAADGPGLWATEPSFAPEGSSFTPVLVGPDQSRTALRTVRLSLPGSHNVRNALGALAAAVACGADPDLAISGLEQFRGAGRRFELVGEANGLAFRDDYAHHPTEIRAAIEAARQTYPGRRLIVVFQPHLWSRTRDFMDGFADALGAADSVVLVGVYSAREKPIPGVHLRDIVKRISEAHPAKTVLCEPDKHKVADVVLWLARRGDVVMTVGAGDIREVAMDLMTRTSVEMPHES